MEGEEPVAAHCLLGRRGTPSMIVEQIMRLAINAGW